ncbi:hypothetical protein R3I94_008809 [Phoxinus phoxinus]
MHFEECFLVKHNGKATLTNDAIPKLVDCDNPPTLASPPLKRRKKTEAKQRQSEEQEEERDIIDTEVRDRKKHRGDTRNYRGKVRGDSRDTR